MSQKIKIDYHFHPNIAYRTNWSKQNRLESLWKQINKVGLDGILVCEHASKKPAWTFNQFLQSRPDKIDTYLIPGIEVLTQKGIHIIVYSKDKSYIYSQKKLLNPWELSFDQVIKKIKDDKKLSGIVVHPYILSSTGIVKSKGLEYAKKAIEEVGAVEVYNHSYIQLEKLLGYTLIEKMFGDKQKKWIGWNKKLPDFLHASNDNILSTGGSDSHHPWEVGSHMELSIQKNINDYDSFFETVFQSNSREFIERKVNFKFLQFVRSSLTILREWFIKYWKKILG